MTANGATTDLARGVLAGEVGPVARMITRVERGTLDGADELAELYRAGGRAKVIGITGPAGTGKSTLVAALGAELRGRDLTLGIVAVDPTSPYSGGSVLGDRIRMQALGDDPGVFIRSMASRGALGGIARATVAALADALDRHHAWLLDSGGMEERQRSMARHRLKTLLTALVHERLDRPVPGSAFESAVEALCKRTTDPWTAAHALLEGELSGRSRGRP